MFASADAGWYSPGRERGVLVFSTERHRLRAPFRGTPVTFKPIFISCVRLAVDVIEDTEVQGTKALRVQEPRQPDYHFSG